MSEVLSRWLDTCHTCLQPWILPLLCHLGILHHHHRQPGRNLPAAVGGTPPLLQGDTHPHFINIPYGSRHASTNVPQCTLGKRVQRSDAFMEAASRVYTCDAYGQWACDQLLRYVSEGDMQRYKHTQWNPMRTISVACSEHYLTCCQIACTTRSQLSSMQNPCGFGKIRHGSA